MFSFSNQKEKVERIKKIFEDQQEAIRAYLEENKAGKFCTVRNGPCAALDFLSWKKDKNHLYISANVAMCIEFFRLPKECMDDIRGKSDIDLVNAFRERTGKVHSYGELCHSTDEIIKKTKKAGHFIEMGYIDKELYILDAYKRPIIDIKGNFVGSEGYAFNRGASAKLFEGMIQYGIEHGCLKVLDIVDDQAAVYEILDVCPSTAFLSGFPAQ